MRRVAILSSLILPLGLFVFVNSIRAQTIDDMDGCENEGNPKLAIDYCTRAIASAQLPASRLVIALTNRGNAYNSKGDYNHAIQDFDQAILLDPNHAYAFNGRGNSHNYKREFDQAIRDFDQAIGIIPTYAYAFNGRGNAYNDKGQYDRAIQDYDEAIRIIPTYANAFNGRGNAYNSKGEHDRAIQDYDEAIRLRPNNAYAFNGRGNAYNSKGDYDKAIEDYDRAAQLNPNFAGAFFNRGFTRFEQGLVAAAVPDFAKSAELAPADRYSALWLYVVATRSGQNADASLANAQKLDLVSWPGPLLSLFLKKADRKALLEAANDPDPRKKRDRLCEVHFFLAEQEFLAGIQRASDADFREAANTCRPTSLEYLAAAAELKRLRQSPSPDGVAEEPDTDASK
jgi:tetratricopeptide (TPR) repeat protein